MKPTLYGLVVFAFTMVNMGCNDGPEIPASLRPLALADQVILYSIDGNDYEPGKEPKAAEKFGRYPVLGKTELGKEARAEVIAALASGLNKDFPAKCYWPRHVLRAIKGESVVDFVICFQCNQTFVYADGERTELRFSKNTQPALDKHLKAAGIPLAP